MKKLALLGLILLGGCKDLHPRSVSDAAHDLCVAVFSERPETLRQSKQQGISPLEVAKIACAANDVVRPFMLAGREAGDEAMGHAERLGLVR